MKTNFEKNINALLKKLLQFEYRIESVDHLWDIIFRDKENKYYHIRIVKSHKIFYLIDIVGKLCTLEIKRNESVRVKHHLGLILMKIKNWIKAAKEIYKSYPLNRRYGIVPNSVIRFSLPDLYQIDEELGKAKTKKYSYVWLRRVTFILQKTQFEKR